MNVQIADSGLKFLRGLVYVEAAGAVRGKSSRFILAAKGVRYLRSRGVEA